MPLSGRLPCSQCAKSFQTQRALDQHTSASHPEIRSQTGTSGSRPDYRKSSTKQQGLHSRPNAAARTVASSSQTPQSSSSWSLIPESEQLEVLELLSTHVHSNVQLLRNNFILSPYTEQYIAGLWECTQCNRLQWTSEGRNCVFHPGKRAKDKSRTYLCCGTKNKGCIIQFTHTYQESPNAAKYRNMSFTPPAILEHRKRRAVVLDCEMASVRNGSRVKQELLVVCVVDFLTGETLLNKLVKPVETIVNYLTWCHGITHSKMQAAIAQDEALYAWKEARQAVWDLIDRDTIVIGHALQHDLDILRMMHTRCVDSAVLSRGAVGVPSRQWALKTLCDELPRVEIRKNIGEVHNCLEDVMATREVVLWCIQHKEEFGKWATVQKEREQVKLKERRTAQQKKTEERAKLGNGKAKVLKSGSGSGYRDDYEDNDDIERWEDIAEDLGYPHPDTGYDPWSD